MSKYKSSENPKPDLSEIVFRNVTEDLGIDVVRGLMEAGQEAAKEGFDGISYSMEENGIDIVAISPGADYVDFARAGETAGQIFALRNEIAQRILGEMLQETPPQS